MHAQRCAIALIAALGVVACAEQSRSPVTPAGPLAAATSGPTDPTATWKIPLAAAGLGLRSDGLFGDGTYSVYADGVCGTSAKIFATTQYSNSGDATIQTTAPKGKTCGRRFTLSYPDGTNETLPSFNNLQQLENTTYAIAVGATVRRRLLVSPGSLANNPSRCGRLIFGPNGSVGAGSDSVLVTRLDARTWQVESQTAPSNQAYCENEGSLLAMPVSFVVVSSAALP